MFKYFLRQPRKTGALCSSSNALANMMTNNIGLDSAKYIVEIGPGLGVFTKQIIKHKNPESNFFVLEVNSVIANDLRKKFKDIEIINENANKLLEIMASKQIENIDVVVSGIPWSIVREKDQNNMLDIIHKSLKEGGHFSTFAYALPTIKAKKFRKKLFDRFKHIKMSQMVWLNFPPAYVYYCRK